MPNLPAKFITNDNDENGSSLYYVTAHWVIRCSGGTYEYQDEDGRPQQRVATTFIRQRDITYRDGNQNYDYPQIGAHPVEGGHVGNAIAAILDHIITAQPPANWRSARGVAWATAVAEIDAAIEYAQRWAPERASREVNKDDFKND